MKYLVVSDSHGDRQVLVDLFNHYKGKVDYIFHCGDSELPADDPVWDGVYVVTGNTDFDSRYKKAQVVDTEEDIVYLTHGHLSSVKMGLMQLDMQAQEYEATIALFGHTHQLGCEVNKGRLFLNPGSILQPRGGISVKTYAIIESTTENFQVQYYDRNFEPIEDLSFIFNK
ncbi:metallophosphoesterase [Tetragenococcus koreensis]|uniref:Phosphoesterase n=1 Tax=Tetragenococcus koreensis TaxID=290335 RepID=A0AAN4RIG8_9ENTE|nr:metallophosphoesterase [Tetragenococcus koreensis]AYW44959.1 YfcE family phosphodiesterase [Tetragenococcus koreensis]MCF1616422.1 metallophosphoesterase [Tetragenococcus koreensis]MCF1621085.1 metallophosphoesterase [Tetragenococcus koreensis]MCF1626500.1 metallophosphoesterase [Tetragenococcus koreensis]MCF1631469.1 metallophosphoesterase [Tetragenococcus koreensis]